ncbi:MAG TPA: hypothetical protein VM076_01715 [Gemmatimonadaceae bacterium]|nr:hypothetical protein [Gemmatimonadaceae bacterium]
MAIVLVCGVNLRFFRTTADTVITVRTDEAGTVTAMLEPGEYRLMSTSPVDWEGARYSTGGTTLGAAGMVAFFGSWLYSVMDAGAAARRFNSALGLGVAVLPMVPHVRAGRARVGLSLVRHH